MKSTDLGRKNILPSEDVLAKKLDVSRTALRDGLSLLESQLIITRKRGIGTIINRDILALKNRLDLETDFFNYIKNAGYKPAIKTVKITEEKLKLKNAKKMHMKEGAELLKVEKLLAGDDFPLIYCANYIPKYLIKDKTYDKKYFHKYLIFDFLRKYCQKEVHYEVSLINPIIFDEEQLKIFEIDPEQTQSALLFSEISYDINNKPIMFSKEIHRTDLLSHKIVRRKIKS